MADNDYKPTPHQVRAMRRRYTDIWGNHGADELIQSLDCACYLGADHEYLGEQVRFFEGDN
jgi:hypothetical protein